MFENVATLIIDALKLVEGGDKYNWSIGEPRSLTKLPRANITLFDGGPTANQAYVREWSVTLTIDVAKASRGVFEAMDFCNRLSANPGVLASNGQTGIVNAIVHSFSDQGSITSDSITRIEQNIDIIEQYR